MKELIEQEKAFLEKHGFQCRDDGVWMRDDIDSSVTVEKEDGWFRVRVCDSHSVYVGEGTESDLTASIVKACEDYQKQAEVVQSAHMDCDILKWELEDEDVDSEG